MEITNISIKDLEVQFISQKKNNFKTMMYYFKMVEFEAKKKLKFKIIGFIDKANLEN